MTNAKHISLICYILEMNWLIHIMATLQYVTQINGFLDMFEYFGQ